MDIIFVCPCGKQLRARKVGRLLQQDGFFDGAGAKLDPRKSSWKSWIFSQQDGFFGGAGAKTVKLSRSGNGFVVSFLLRSGGWDWPDVSEHFRNLRSQIALALDGRPVEIHLCDEYLEVKRTFK